MLSLRRQESGGVFAVDGSLVMSLQLWESCPGPVFIAGGVVSLRRREWCRVLAVVGSRVVKTKSRANPSKVDCSVRGMV